MIRADCHVHIYPEFKLERLLLTSKSQECVFLLTERSDCNFFSRLQQHPEVSETSEAAVKIGRSYWIAGRQLVTAERLEVQALCTQVQIPDGLSFHECLRCVRQAGGVTVTSWAPGKWLGRRGKIIRQAIEEAKPGELLLADSTLRPQGFFEPPLLKLARQKGLGILAGSDPLPFAGQESLIGSYGVLLPGFDSVNPLESVRKVLTTPYASFEKFGKRSTIFGVALRLLKLKMCAANCGYQSQRTLD